MQDLTFNETGERERERKRGLFRSLAKKINTLVTDETCITCADPEFIRKGKGVKL